MNVAVVASIESADQASKLNTEERRAPSAGGVEQRSGRAQEHAKDERRLIECLMRKQTKQINWKATTHTCMKPRKGNM